ncbi:MAG: 23S rRNA (uracil(1939)-C(5))-methyltransferase RlmD [Clostridia bacterium]|nr:23S rRNA (uracil(1939)-C(5))-methyltransferase RlmD [Clostridia bacterium]
MVKNQEKIGVVIALGMNGEGILKDEDYTIFVPFALPTEKIKYKVLKVSKNCVYGKLLEVLTPAEERVRTKCKVFTKCGGCQLQHLRYSAQLSAKENNIKTCFSKIANLKVEVMPAVKGECEYRYRNKLQLPVRQTENGAILGFYAENSHRVIEIEDCEINGYYVQSIIKAFKRYFTEYNVKGYEEQTHSGDVREITVKEVGDKLIITVVTLSRILPHKEELLKILREEIKQDFSLYQNVNSAVTNVIYGKEFILHYGKGEYQAEMFSVKYKIGVQSFMQVNTSVCHKLYSAVREGLNLNEKTIVIDAYSGAGLMTALLAQRAKKAIGVEIIKEAVDIANKLATDNGLKDKIINYCGKCEELLPKIIKREKQENNDVAVVLDPPRKGVDIKVIKAILESDIDRIAYVSCLPSSLARDIGLLVGTLEEKDGEIKRVENPTLRYNIELIKPFDMFAQTKHVETLVILNKNK